MKTGVVKEAWPYTSDDLSDPTFEMPQQIFTSENMLYIFTGEPNVRKYLAICRLRLRHGEDGASRRNTASANNAATNISRPDSRTDKADRTSHTPIGKRMLTACKEINRIKAKAKLQKWELDQMAKKHDEEQKKKNDGAELKVARKFMNYIEYGRTRDRGEAC